MLLAPAGNKKSDEDQPNFGAEAVGAVVRREVRLTSGGNGRAKTVPSDRLCHCVAAVRAKERVSGEDAKTVGKGLDFGCVGGVIAREVVDESSADLVNIGKAAVRPLEVQLLQGEVSRALQELGAEAGS